DSVESRFGSVSGGEPSGEQEVVVQHSPEGAELAKEAGGIEARQDRPQAGRGSGVPRGEGVEAAKSAQQDELRRPAPDAAERTELLRQRRGIQGLVPSRTAAPKRPLSRTCRCSRRRRCDSARA